MPPTMPPFFLVNPVARSFVITERFNAPRNYTFAPTKRQQHEGVDIASIDAQGRPVAVLAAQRGIVDKVDFSPQGYGNYVRIVHEWNDERYITWYGHLTRASVRVGDFVLAGQKIGVSGTTGFSSGIHLHLTLQHIGHGLANYTVDDVIDPEPFFMLGPVPAFTELTYLRDVTVPDGTELLPGQSFEKTWRVRNTGTTPWDNRFGLIHAGGELLDGPVEITALHASVLPGQIVNVSLRLVAPHHPGEYEGVWRLCDEAGSHANRPLTVLIRTRDIGPHDEATYVADVTIEDGTILQPGERFTKTWRVRNTGTTTWDERYTLRWVGHERMGGPDVVPLDQAVPPSAITTLTVPLVAPTTPGRARSTWKLHDPNGQPFDFEQYAEIQVPQQPPAPDEGLSELRWVADVTVPDGMRLQGGQRFMKTWRVRNTGTTAWDERYTLRFAGDERMGGPDGVPLPHTRPGEMAEISIPLIAPREAGAHRSSWKPVDPQGNMFEFDLFALIEVDQPADGQFVAELSWVEDVTFPDGADVQPGQTFVKTWRVRNTGTIPWGEDYALVHFADEQLGGPDETPLPPLKPGESGEVSIRLKAPPHPGMVKSTWKGRDPQGRLFDFDLFALVEVVDPANTIDMLDYLRGDGRLYALASDWPGGERANAQTQIEDMRFYHTWGVEWREFWFDDNYIFVGTDTAPLEGETGVIALSENGAYGSAWLPRQMTLGVPFRRSPLVTIRQRSDGAPLRHSAEVTWAQLDALHDTLTLPGGITLDRVALVAIYADENGQPASQPSQRYFFAEKWGLVAWEGPRGRLRLVGAELPPETPANTRVVLNWPARG